MLLQGHKLILNDTVVSHIRLIGRIVACSRIIEDDVFFESTESELAIEEETVN